MLPSVWSLPVSPRRCGGVEMFGLSSAELQGGSHVGQAVSRRWCPLSPINKERTCPIPSGRGQFLVTRLSITGMVSFVSAAASTLVQLLAIHAWGRLLLRLGWGSCWGVCSVFLSGCGGRGDWRVRFFLLLLLRASPVSSVYYSNESTCSQRSG